MARGMRANFGKSAGEFVSLDAGLTDSDREFLEVVEDNTDEVIGRLDIAIAKALEAVGIAAERDAKKLCPVDTGRLRNSITHTIDGDEKAAIIGTNVEYAEAVHDGAHGRKGQPFLTDAIDHNGGRYRRIFKSMLESG